MLPVNTGGHSAYQNFVTENLRKYYPNPDLIPRATWDIIERFWYLDLSYTDDLTNTLSLILCQGLLPVCSVPICCLLILK